MDIPRLGVGGTPRLDAAHPVRPPSLCRGHVVLGSQWNQHTALAWSRGGTVAHARRRRQESQASPAVGDEQDQPVDLPRKIDAISAALDVRRSHVASLVRQQPDLAEFPVEVLAARVRRLSDVLGVPPVQALVMAARIPAVVAANPDELRCKAERLGAALGLPVEQAAFLAARQPGLLEYAPESVASDCARLGASLGASPRGVLQLLARVGTRELRMLLGASGGMLREQLIDVLEALGLPATSTRQLDTLRMVAKCPGLLCTPPARVAESCEALVGVFQAAPATFVHVLNRCPSLLTYPDADIRANYRGLGRLLGLPPPVLARLLAAQPRLLRCRPEDAQTKLEALIYELYMPREQVLSLVVRQPTLLLLSVDLLRTKIEALQRLLGGAQYQIAAMVLAKQPSLAGFGAEVLEAKHAALCEAAGLAPAKVNEVLLRYPLVLTLATSQLQETCSFLMEEMGFDERWQLGELLGRHPQLLLCGVQALEDALDDLQLFLGLERQEAAAILRRNPPVLQASAGVWRDNLQALVRELGLPPSQARAAVLAHPRLLRRDPQALSDHCARLRRLVDASPPWREQLQRLDGRRLATALRYDAGAWARVEYLVKTRQQDSLELGSSVVMDPQAFARMFPRATQWLRQRGRAPAAGQQRQQQGLGPSAGPGLVRRIRQQQQQRAGGQQGGRSRRPRQQQQREQDGLPGQRQQQQWQREAGDSGTPPNRRQQWNSVGSTSDQQQQQQQQLDSRERDQSLGATADVDVPSLSCTSAAAASAVSVAAVGAAAPGEQLATTEGRSPELLTAGSYHRSANE